MSFNKNFLKDNKSACACAFSLSGSRHVRCSYSVGMGPDQQPVPGGDLLPAVLVHRCVCYRFVWLPDAELLLEILTAGLYSLFLILSHSVLVSGRGNERFCIIMFGVMRDFVSSWLAGNGLPLCQMQFHVSNSMIHQSFQKKLHEDEFELKKRKHDAKILWYTGLNCL